MKGFSILHNEALETVQNGSTVLGLLGRGEGVEVMRQTIIKGTEFILFPGDNPEAKEFYYLIRGEAEGEVDGEKVTLGADTFLSVKGMEGTLAFKVTDDLTLLSITTEPVFHLLSNEIDVLRRVGEQVEVKDRYTHKHSSRVANYAVKTALKMKLPKERTHTLFLAAILHDIGKIHVPEEVLNKPGKLTAEEFELIKKHPGDGAEMVRKTAYADLASIIEQHHERLNGSGYPAGLRGEEILLEARIIGVCDTFDAMTEDRSYRKAFPPEAAAAEIRRLTGTHYDPAVVAAFLEAVKEEGKIGSTDGQ